MFAKNSLLMVKIICKGWRKPIQNTSFGEEEMYITKNDNGQLKYS